MRHVHPDNIGGPYSAVQILERRQAQFRASRQLPNSIPAFGVALRWWTMYRGPGHDYGLDPYSAAHPSMSLRRSTFDDTDRLYPDQESDVDSRGLLVLWSRLFSSIA